MKISINVFEDRDGWSVYKQLPNHFAYGTYDCDKCKIENVAYFYCITLSPSFNEKHLCEQCYRKSFKVKNNYVQMSIFDL